MYVDRSPSLGAFNSHTKPVSWHFYRLVYFKAFFFVKEINSGLHERVLAREMMPSGKNVKVIAC